MRAYILSFSSGSTGVFFFTLTAKGVDQLSFYERLFIGVALIFFVATTVLCLIELRIDAKRFFNIAKQFELPEGQRSWDKNEAYKKLRIRFIYTSYTTASVAVLATVCYLVMRLT